MGKSDEKNEGFAGQAWGKRSEKGLLSRHVSLVLRTQGQGPVTVGIFNVPKGKVLNTQCPVWCTWKGQEAFKKWGLLEFLGHWGMPSQAGVLYFLSTLHHDHGMATLGLYAPLPQCAASP